MLITTKLFEPYPCERIERRQALKALVASVLSGSSIAQAQPFGFGGRANNGIFLGGGRYQEAVQAPAKFVVCQVTLLSDGRLDIQNIATTFFPHGFAVDPTNKARLIAFEKIGFGACEVNLKALSVERKVNVVNDRLFYGHGVFSKDGGLLFSTETVLSSGQGVIAVRDGKTLAYLGDFPTYGSHPHDCNMSANGKVLIVTNGGDERTGTRKPNLSYIDIGSQRLLEQLPIADESFNTGHVETVNSGATVVISAPRRGLGPESLGAIHMRTKDGVLKRAGVNTELAERLTGEALSCVIIPERDLFVVTHPTPGLLTFWRLSTLESVKVLPFSRVRGVAITNDRAELAVAYGTHAGIGRVKIDGLVPVEGLPNTQTLISGSHLLNWSSI
jgi:uncharacterized protein